MAEERLGASFSIDVTDLKAGLAQANRLIKESQSEFKAAAAGMDDWSSSQEGLTAKIKSLNDITDIQRKKVDALESEYDSLIAGGLDPASKAAVDLRTKINNEKAALAANEKELQKQQTALEELENSSDDASDAVEDVGDAAKESSDGFTVAKGAIADLISSGLQALVGACKNALTSLAGLAGETRESRAAFAKLENAFDTAGFSADTAQGTMKELYGVLGDADKANEAASLMVKMSKSQEDLDANTRILTGVFAEYGDSIPTEGLAEGMSATAAMGEVQGVLADALEWQGINLDDYNAKLQSMSSEEERAAYIQETLTDLYGESADKFRENNGELISANEAQLEYNNSLNDLGAKIEPITTKVREGFNKILEKVLELTDGVDFDAIADGVERAFDAFLNDILPKIVDGLDWIKENKDVLIAGIAGIGAAFAAFKVVSLISSVTSAMKGMSLAQAALNLVMSLNPIGLVVAAIAGLVTAFVVLWKKSDKFRNFWKKLWKDIQKQTEKIWKAIKEIFSKSWDAIKKVFSSVGTFFKNVWKSIEKAFSSAVTWFKDTFTKAWNAIKNAFASVQTFFSDIWAKIKSAFSSVKTWFSDTFTAAWNAIKDAFASAKDFFTGIWDGIKNVFSTTKTWFSDTFKAAWSAVKNAFSSVGNFFGGVWSTIKNKLSSVTSWFKEKFSGAWQAVKDVFSSVGEFFGGIWDTIKEKFTNIGQKVGESVSSAFKTAINAVLSTAETVLNKPINAINNLIDNLGLPIGKLSTFELPRMATGGVVNRATAAVIGEDGAEAVVPLEKNTEWLDKLADKLADKMSIANGGVVVNQTNNFSQAHSRLELYKAKQQTAAAVRLVTGGKAYA